MSDNPFEAFAFVASEEKTVVETRSAAAEDEAAEPINQKQDRPVQNLGRAGRCVGGILIDYMFVPPPPTTSTTQTAKPPPE